MTKKRTHWMGLAADAGCPRASRLGTSTQTVRECHVMFRKAADLIQKSARKNDVMRVLEEIHPVDSVIAERR